MSPADADEIARFVREARRESQRLGDPPAVRRALRELHDTLIDALFTGPELEDLGQGGAGWSALLKALKAAGRQARPIAGAAWRGISRAGRAVGRAIKRAGGSVRDLLIGAGAGAVVARSREVRTATQAIARAVEFLLSPPVLVTAGVFYLVAQDRKR